MLDFRIATFLDVCQTLNYTRTAQRLNLTQPAVSQHIHVLEENYGTELFTYRNRKLSLTDTGRMLKALATTMAHDDEELRRRIAQTDGTPTRINIGVTRTAGVYALAPALATYLNVHPETQLNVNEDDTRILLSQLEEGLLGCALVEGVFERQRYDWQTFSREPFICVCAANHGFSHRPQNLSDLLDERLIVREEGSGTRAVLEHLLEEENLRVDDFPRRCTVSSIGIIREFVRKDCGITFIYRAAVDEDLKAGKLREIKITDIEHTHAFTFVWRKGSAYADDYRKFIDELMSLETSPALG